MTINNIGIRKNCLENMFIYSQKSIVPTQNKFHNILMVN